MFLPFFLFLPPSLPPTPYFSPPHVVRPSHALVSGLPTSHPACHLSQGEIGDGMDVLVRVHSECLTGDIFASQRCDCGPQLHKSLQLIQREGRGVCVYLRGHEGRGIGLSPKLLAYNLQASQRWSSFTCGVNCVHVIAFHA